MATLYPATSEISMKADLWDLLQSTIAYFASFESFLDTDLTNFGYEWDGYTSQLKQQERESGGMLESESSMQLKVTALLPVFQKTFAIGTKFNAISVDENTLGSGLDFD
ncbi:hypothetical protein RUND412_000375 [Rhizina undulata]